MIQVNLTPQETVLLYGILEGTLDNLTVQTADKLSNPELTLSLIESVMGKIAKQVNVN